YRARGVWGTIFTSPSCRLSPTAASSRRRWLRKPLALPPVTGRERGYASSCSSAPKHDVPALGRLHPIDIGGDVEGGRRRVVSPVLVHEVQAGGLHPTDARAHHELPKCYRPRATYALTFRSASLRPWLKGYLMRELTELDRERILQAEAEHRAAAEAVKRFL